MGDRAVGKAVSVRGGANLRTRFRTVLAAGAALLALAPATASETISYTYDARGRLVQVGRSGTVNSGTSASYTYDNADNRANVSVATGGGSAPSFAISNTTVTEGGTASFTVTRSGPTSGSYTLSYTTANGTATAGSDYSSKSGTLTFGDGVTSQTVTVATLQDTAVESNETFHVDLSNASGGSTITDSHGTATISDDDSSGGVSFSISSNGPVTEGANSVFTITKSGTATSTLSVSYATSNGTAVAGSDYTAKSGSISFTISQTSKTVSVLTTDDTAAESAETFAMALSAPTGGATIGTGSATATINDNDSASTCSGVSFTIASNAAVTEGSSSVFTITKSGSTSSSCTVSYATANGSAAAGSDYTAASGTLTFTSAQTSKTVSVATTDDSSVESAETFSMGLSNATDGATVGTPGSATATINDNDSSGGTCSSISFSVNNTSATEADPLVFTVTKSGSTAGSCSVSYATANGTATAGTSTDDYAAASGTLTFTSAQTSKTVSITTYSNGFLGPEPDETMYVNLSGATDGGSISDSQGVGTIFDDGASGCQTCLQSAPEEESLEGSTTTDPETPDPGTTDPGTTEDPPESTEPPPGAA